MSAYDPPTQILPVFNPLFFESTSLADLDVSYLNENYLKFPIAQGLENLQKTNITDATQSTSVSTGSLVTAGGVGIAKQTHIGGQLHCTSTATSTSTTTGCIRASGGVGIAENLNVGGTTSSTGLITATGGLTTGAGSVLTSTGTTTLTGATTATGLITANGGLTMGGANNITLGSGATAPTSGQLGYTQSFTLANLAGGTGSRDTTNTSVDLPVGVYMCTLHYQIDITFPTTTRTIIEFRVASNATLVNTARLGFVYSPAMQEYNYYSFPAILKVTANPCSVFSTLTTTGGNNNISSAVLSVVRIA